MRKIERIFTGICLISSVVVISGTMIGYINTAKTPVNTGEVFDTQYGAFLAAQHAIYVNDYKSAAEFSNVLDKTEYANVKNVRVLSDFLNGKIPDNVADLKDDKTGAARIIYDAHLVLQDEWKAFQNRHKKDTSPLTAPFRIWSGIANDWRTNTLKFIDTLPTNSSWKAFVRGQIYVELGDIDRANQEFANVHPDFMNLNDYMYLMSFYNHFGFIEDAKILHDDFTSRPGGLFLADFDAFPDWSLFSGYKNQLAFSLVQNVSHTKIMMYSDLSVMHLRFAQIIAPEFYENNDAIKYYLGQYFYTNNGNYQDAFEQISSESPFKLFATLRDAERKKDMVALEKLLDKSPVFVPALNTVIGNKIKNGERRSALRIVNRAINDKTISEYGRAFFVKSRAYINYVFGDLEAAQSDLHDAAEVLHTDADILSLQAKIWAAQNREIQTAYEYAMGLVQRNPSDVAAWDTLGCVVAVREGTLAALDVLERVGEVSRTQSSLFERLGDLYVQTGDKDRAVKSYNRAIELADDGLVVVPLIERKLRKIK